MSGLLVRWPLARAAGLAASMITMACSGSTDRSMQPDERTERVDTAGAELTIASVNDLWGAGAVIDACFLTTNFATQQQWMKEDLYRTWEFAANLRINWLASCPATGSLMRIGMATARCGEPPVASPSCGQSGWATQAGIGAKRDERASNGASLTSPKAEQPSIKLYLHDVPDGRSRVAYLDVHEWGHALGFQEELFHPDATGSCSAGSASPNAGFIEVTAYDQNSIMNYCNNTGNNRGVVTAVDIEGIQSLYGMGPRYLAAIAFVTSA